MPSSTGITNSRRFKILLLSFLCSQVFSIGVRAQSIESNRAHADQLEIRAYNFFVSAGYDSSLACYERAENLYANAADWTDALECLNREADVLIRLAQYEKALADLKEPKKSLMTGSHRMIQNWELLIFFLGMYTTTSRRTKKQFAISKKV